jgi:alcohol dehydrogenase (cytochrome c)
MTLRRRFTASAAALFALASVSLRGAQEITSKDLLDGLANPSRWLTHSGDYTGARFSPLTQITPANAGRLAAQWTFQTGVANKFEATPIVIDGAVRDRPALTRGPSTRETDARSGTTSGSFPRG